ncbi:PAS domain-containing protein [Methylobacterium radiodurans]|uniref:PAS domain-containing protein n=1 Tax=Methylobacterium radiodurans TaxID=2202828 RepID=UPI0013A531FD|nr:PAS domain-containing protein [Methylobacterium radiodurans]
MRVTASEERAGSFPDLRRVLDASGIVGTWDWYVTRRTVLFDEGAAALLAGDPQLAGRELRNPEATAGIHPDDLGWVMAEMARALEAGGVILAEYRVRRPDGSVRWVLSRGRVYLDGEGRPLRAHGLLIDITESREEGQRYVAHAVPSKPAPTDRLMDLCGELRMLADTMPSSTLRLLVDLVLLEIGRSGLDAPEPGSRH